MNKIVTRLFEDAYSKRVPLIATIEITNNCNFRCVHCYLNEKRNDYLSYDNVTKFIDQFCTLGGMYLTITGGEPLLHPQFLDIYKYAIKKGLVITLFTNASLITDDIIHILSAYKPRRIEITLYGYTNDTYQKVTGEHKINIDKILKNIVKIKNAGIEILVKVFVLKDNYMDVEEIIQFVHDNKLKIKMDYLIIDRNKSRLEANQIYFNQIKEILIKQDEVDANENLNNYMNQNAGNSLYQCGAGRTSCWVKPNNSVQMCNFLEYTAYSLSRYSFKDIWEKYSIYLEESRDREDTVCKACSYKKVCRNCPGLTYGYTGKENRIEKVEKLCDDAIALS